MKTYKPNELIHAPEAPQPRLYTWDEVKSNEGVYKAEPAYLITIKNGDTGGLVTLWYLSGVLEPADKSWGYEQKKFQKLENAKVIFDVIEG